MIVEFKTIVHPVDPKSLLGPFRQVPIDWSEIRKRKNIPSFFYVNRNKDMITLKFFQGNHHFMKQGSIQQQFPGTFKFFYQVGKADRITPTKRQLSFYDVWPGLFVSGNNEVCDYKRPVARSI